MEFPPLRARLIIPLAHADSHHTLTPFLSFSEWNVAWLLPPNIWTHTGNQSRRQQNFHTCGCIWNQARSLFNLIVSYSFVESVQTPPFLKSLRVLFQSNLHLIKQWDLSLSPCCHGYTSISCEEMNKCRGKWPSPGKQSGKHTASNTFTQRALFSLS